jgi:hypothetical protein
MGRIGRIRSRDNEGAMDVSRLLSSLHPFIASSL